MCFEKRDALLYAMCVHGFWCVQKKNKICLPAAWPRPRLLKVDSIAKYNKRNLVEIYSPNNRTYTEHVNNQIERKIPEIKLKQKKKYCYHFAGCQLSLKYCNCIPVSVSFVVFLCISLSPLLGWVCTSFVCFWLFSYSSLFKLSTVCVFCQTLVSNRPINCI